MGGPEKPISDLGKKGYKRFWAGEIARWLLSLEVKGGEEEETVVDVEQCSRETWIAGEDCLAVLREMDGVVVDAGRGIDPRKVKVIQEGEEEKEVEGVKEVDRVRIDKEAVRKWVEKEKLCLDRVVDPEGFIEGYGYRNSGDEDMGD